MPRETQIFYYPTTYLIISHSEKAKQMLMEEKIIIGKEFQKQVEDFVRRGRKTGFGTPYPEDIGRWTAKFLRSVVVDNMHLMPKGVRNGDMTRRVRMIDNGSCMNIRDVEQWVIEWRGRTRATLMIYEWRVSVTGDQARRVENILVKLKMLVDNRADTVRKEVIQQEEEKKKDTPKQEQPEKKQSTVSSQVNNKKTTSGIFSTPSILGQPGKNGQERLESEEEWTDDDAYLMEVQNSLDIDQDQQEQCAVHADYPAAMDVSNSKMGADTTHGLANNATEGMVGTGLENPFRTVADASDCKTKATTSIRRKTEETRSSSVKKVGKKLGSPAKIGRRTVQHGRPSGHSVAKQVRNLINSFIKQAREETRAEGTSTTNMKS